MKKLLKKIDIETIIERQKIMHDLGISILYGDDDGLTFIGPEWIDWINFNDYVPDMNTTDAVYRDAMKISDELKYNFWDVFYAMALDFIPIEEIFDVSNFENQQTKMKI